MKMFVTERRNTILQLLQDKKRITVKELAREIKVSEATLRSDLNNMELDGLLTRTHGGAMLTNEEPNERDFSVREQKNKNEKQEIAKQAIEYIEEKQCILLDASSTVLELARQIKNLPIRLTIVTSGLQTAIELKDSPNITVILIGGLLKKGSKAVEGTLGLDILDSVNIDMMFTSANGFTVENGLTDFSLYEVELKKEMVKRTSKLIALIDHSKIGVNSSAVFAKTNQLDVLVTNKSVDVNMLTELKKQSTEIVTP